MPVFRPSPILATQRLSQLAPLKWFKAPSRTADKPVYVTKRLLEGEKARDTYGRMRQCGIRPCVPVIVLAIKACSERWDLMSLHSDLVATKNDRDVSVANTLIDSYAHFGLVADARKVFDGIQCRDAISWNTMIKGYVQNGDGKGALELFSRIQEDGLLPNARTYLAALQACSMVAAREKGTVVEGGRLVKVATLERGAAIHAEIVKNQYSGDVFVSSGLVDMYSKCGSLENAKLVFDKMEFHDVVSWTAIIMGHCNCGEAELALALFSRMKEEGFIPDGTTFVAVLKACASLAVKETSGSHGEVALASLEKGRALHTELKKLGIKSDMVLESSLVDMYVKCGSLEDARLVFERMHRRDALAWTSMISGTAQAGNGELALQMFARMQEEGIRPDAPAFVAALGACSSLAAREGKRVEGKFKKSLVLQKGTAIHSKLAKIVKLPNAFVENALVDMYAKCGNIQRAREVFDAMLERDLVSWNSMILGLAQNDECEPALKYFSVMQHEGFKPGTRTIVGVFKACAAMVALETGRKFHVEARISGLDNDPTVASSIVDFYAKCGSMSDAQEVFDSLEARDLVTWNALIAGYSCCGDNERVLELLVSAEKEVGSVNGVTLLCVLASYSHAGLVEEGKSFFETMNSRYGVQPGVEHCTSMVDLLSRANRLEEAASMAKRISRDSSKVAWITVLGACFKWKNVEVGKLAFDSVPKEDGDPSPFVLMSNIYAGAGMWEQRAAVRKAMATKSLSRAQGQSSSWVDAAGTVHRFSSEKEKKMEHPQMEEIVAKLSLFLGDKTRNDDQVCEQSERFAAGCALVNTAAGTDIRISKSGRVCGDCHDVLAAISRQGGGGRLVVCKDISCVHAFRDGHCSCGDFW
ncbi:pentatricopeptide repeat-containing protein At2g13600 isoform X1 [Selaginella moellendorffii]|uniref:pentatricopeptide repeat-containing protein At2g13600 isoform X1 n=1 Tax=Selaginella moellendorffii TaxID=88036 RepID=UPI000D1C4519|nr:pentatricopeptide repeat-containing protein At2g13600 isoform X1 [Selaginella moellendorffii]|eukprot:XP_024521940.1 pentatricopeptide repeat-containing protein At2g13600 isoform X1 [Selaginella moellendorffii]